jgi:hypothetical protein
MPGKGGLDESLIAGGKKTTYSGMKQFQNDIGTSWMGMNKISQSQVFGTVFAEGSGSATLDADSPLACSSTLLPGELLRCFLLSSSFYWGAKCSVFGLGPRMDSAKTLA